MRPNSRSLKCKLIHILPPNTVLGGNEYITQHPKGLTVCKFTHFHKIATTFTPFVVGLPTFLRDVLPVARNLTLYFLIGFDFFINNPRNISVKFYLNQPLLVFKKC